MEYSKLQKIVKNIDSNSSAEAYRVLKKGILSGYLLPGERLIEKDLAEVIGISRSPIREAIKKLESEKLVTVEPNKGATVIKMSPIEIEETYFIVGCLEGLAAKCATNNLDENAFKKLNILIHDMSEVRMKQDYKSWLKGNISFHRTYIDVCGNSQLANLILEKREGLSRYWFLACSKPGLLEKCLDDHRKIMDALKQENPERARKCVEQHIMSVGSEIKEFLEKLLII
jgi:DNA-binding GntR family transcriptional regulator